MAQRYRSTELVARPGDEVMHQPPPITVDRLAHDEHWGWRMRQNFLRFTAENHGGQATSTV